MNSTKKLLAKNKKKGSYILQLTAMVDMFTIMIVFLLKSYATSAVELTTVDQIALPVSTEMTIPEERLNIVISSNGVFVDSKKLVGIKDSKMDFKVKEKDPDYIEALFEHLNEQAKIVEKIKKIKNEEFEGKIMLQADAGVPYKHIRIVAYNASLAGYSNVQIATTEAAKREVASDGTPVAPSAVAPKAKK